ncbi:hypothetical protein HDU98_001307, partial [Podochytrium sp. JEL0797]
MAPLSAKALERLKQQVADSRKGDNGGGKGSEAGGSRLLKAKCNHCKNETFASLLKAGRCGKCIHDCMNCGNPAIKQLEGVWLCAVDFAAVGSSSRQTQREPIERNGRMKGKEVVPVALKAKPQETYSYMFAVDARFIRSEPPGCKKPFRIEPLKNVAKQLIGTPREPFVLPANATVQDFTKILFESPEMSHVREAIPAWKRTGELAIAA